MTRNEKSLERYIEEERERRREKKGGTHALALY
jgi:hypothetical protein